MADDNKEGSNGAEGNLSSGTKALIGALLAGGLGAVGGAYFTEAPEDMAPSEVFKARLKNALVTGLAGAIGGGGLGYALGEMGVGGAKATSDQIDDALKNEFGKQGWADLYTPKVAGGVLGGLVGAGAGHKLVPSSWFKGRAPKIGGWGGLLLGGLYGDKLAYEALDWYDKLHAAD